MDVVYLFYEGEKTSIPASYKDPPLRKLFSVTGGGIWNADSMEFNFNRKLDAEKLSRFVPDKPIVQVSNNAITVKSFFGRPWPETDGSDKIYFTQEWQDALENEMRARKYSRNTITAYIYYNQSMCQWLQKSPDTITADDVKKYLAYKEKEENLSAATINISLSAIKFFFCNVLENNSLREQKRPRQDKRLPVVLSKTEIKNLLETERNLKHRLLLMIVYSSGLRVSEVVSLRKQDIDINRKSVNIVCGKGRKDRYTITSDTVIKTLGDYYMRYSVTGWLFPGQPSSSHLSIRSAQHIFENAARRIGLKKNVSIHSLRHTFATHLLESGTDIRYIQDLLGHSSVRTTERYTHVAQRKALTIKSPLDTIDDE